MEHVTVTPKPTFKEAFLFWLKLGFISFGGPAGQIAIMHEFVVEKKKWVSESKFLHALNYCMLLPGPEAQQLATYIGWLLHNTKGGLTAGILFVLPSIFILMFLSIMYVTYGKIPFVYAMFEGLKPAVVAIVITALFKISRRSLNNFFSFIIAGASFVSIYFLNIPFPYVIIASLVTAFILTLIRPKFLTSTNDTDINSSEKEFSINKYSEISHTKFSLRDLTIRIVTGIALWTIPFILIRSVSDAPMFWDQLILFFTQAAFVTFGGAYSVLPYVAQVTVEQLHWLSKLQMIDGLALGETTPGPLIMVLSYVGFIASYNNFNESILAGIAGLLTTTYYTFLPSFMFIFAGAPLIERTQHNERLNQILNIVTSAVVGVILNLTVYFASAIVFPKGFVLSEINYFSLIWIIISFTALYFYRVNVIKWIGISSLIGLCYYLINSSVNLF